MKLSNKYIYLISLILLFIFYNCSSNKKETNFSIKGTWENFDSDHFYIATDLYDSIVVDTIFVDKKGKFSYKGKTEGLTLASLYFNQKAWSISIFIDKGWNIEIKGDVNKPDLVMVNGGNVNDDLTSFKKENISLFNSKAEILRQLAEADTPESIHAYNTELKNINFELTNRARVYIENNPDKIASVVLIQDFYKNNTSIEILENELNTLTGAAEEYSLTKDLKVYIQTAKLSQTGANAPNIKLLNDKKEIDLKAYKGKYLILSFSSKSEENSQTVSFRKNIYQVLKDKNVELITLFLDSEPDKNLNDSIPWPVFYDNKGWGSDAVRLYNITEIPYNILISPEGKIVERGVMIPNVPEIMAEIEKEKKVQ